MLSLTRRRWVVAAGDVEETIFQRRGVHTAEERAAFLAPALCSLPDPSCMADMDRATDRIVRAIRTSGRILVYGDYDVDGVSATALLVEVLRAAGAQAEFYIPHRQHQGYGLHPEVAADLGAKVDVLITADCGITAHDAIARAAADVIVVDHHLVPETLPPAYACLDPQRHDCQYPFKGLCATGVAFLLACSLRRALAIRFDARRLLDLVALATVADMVPLVGPNRVLVAQGLRVLARGLRPGLVALATVARVPLAQIRCDHLAFQLGPRVNAQGRLSHAGDAVELLLTQDAATARRLAEGLDAHNAARREIEQETCALARARVDPSGASIVLFDEAWHSGVLGLVASRLTRAFAQPAVVIGAGGRGSGRSLPGLDLHACMAAGRAHTLTFGGHAQAAGLTLVPGNVPAFARAFDAAVRERLGPPPYIQILDIDAAIPESAITAELWASMRGLAPFGQGNPAPLFVTRNLRVADCRAVGKNSEHLKLRLGQVDAIAFRMGPLAAQVGDRVDAAYRLDVNEYRGQTTLQLHIEDLGRPAP
jgi:single-stranded-DNA-specific exonuclease